MAGLKNARQVVGRLRSHVTKASRELAAIETAMAVEDALDGNTRFGTYRFRPGVPIDEAELLAFLRSARREHPEQELVVAVIAREGTD